MRANLLSRLWATANAAPLDPAFHLGGGTLSYGELVALARRSAGALKDVGGLVAIVASGSPTAYGAVLGSAWLGLTYAPVSPFFPPHYIKALLGELNPAAIVYDENVQNPKLFEGFSCPKLGSLEGGEIEGPPREVSPQSIVHVMFTSGSTGKPKKIGQTLANIDAYLAACRELYPMTPADRLSHYSELGWDPYLFDLFMAWEAGASCYAVPRGLRLAPAGFIRKHRLTVWYSVPSVVQLMERMRHLDAGAFDSLRLTLFVGEPLGRKTVDLWAASAPGSRIINVYGPTECTVVCTGMEVTPGATPLTPGRNHYPVGKPYPGTTVKLSDDGEIVIFGAQVVPGYLDDPQRTAQSFAQTPDGLCYKTGDLGQIDRDGVLHFLGRADNQVKVLGNRVELEALEAVAASLGGVSAAIAVAGEVREGIVQNLFLAVEGEARESEVLALVAQKLPSCMIPKRIAVVPRLPRNANGKADRKQVRELFDQTSNDG